MQAVGALPCRHTGETHGNTGFRVPPIMGFMTTIYRVSDVLNPKAMFDGYSIFLFPFELHEFRKCALYSASLRTFMLDKPAT